MDGQEKTNDLFILIKEFREKIPTNKTLAEDAIEFCKALESTVPGIKTEIEFEEKIEKLEQKLDEEEKLYRKIDEELTREKDNAEKLEREESILLTTLSELVESTPDAKLRDQTKKLLDKAVAHEIPGKANSSMWLQLQ